MLSRLQKPLAIHDPYRNHRQGSFRPGFENIHDFDDGLGIIFNPHKDCKKCCRCNEHQDSNPYVSCRSVCGSFTQTSTCTFCYLCSEHLKAPSLRRCYKNFVSFIRTNGCKNCHRCALHTKRPSFSSCYSQMSLNSRDERCDECYKCGSHREAPLFIEPLSRHGSALTREEKLFLRGVMYGEKIGWKEVEDEVSVMKKELSKLKKANALLERSHEDANGRIDSIRREISSPSGSGLRPGPYACGLPPPSLFPENIGHLTILMESAHGYHANRDSLSSLKKIKAMIGLAECIPRHDRTDTQAFLQKDWRSPSPTMFGPLLPIVAFADASDWGICFYLSCTNQSLAYAWASGDTAIPVGPSGQVITSWAEFIAVEMTIHTLIMLEAIDTLYPTVILSDNEGVVKALCSGYWTPNYGLDEIVRRIISTCYTHRIILDIRWIPSAANLADAASKGRFSSPQLQEMEEIWASLYDPKLTRLLMIPPHLRSLTEPIGF